MRAFGSRNARRNNCPKSIGWRNAKATLPASVRRNARGVKREVRWGAEAIGCGAADRGRGHGRRTGRIIRVRRTEGKAPRDLAVCHT